ncbi:pseudouridine synthase [Shewanella chilikensis]|jgi:16S rRNA pseudouridine516 synthase|uniref:Pseudouridine synthase n=1 Tax=Shewanella chilikensis TaxID=558541 RepID=A0ABX5PND7_9GAMM|nr:pseudouridine synthase [Shewanella chilikensis]PYE58409.1 pseudouridine synthase [Shewanella chilikensis]
MTEKPYRDDATAPNSSQQATIRLAHYLAQSGLCSRREAARRIEAGEIFLGDKLAKHTDRVTLAAGQRHCLEKLFYQGEPISPPEPHSYLLFNKPVGIDCRLLKDDPSSLLHLLPQDKRLYPAGRLDKDSRGLLLLSNDGELTHKLMHPDFCHSKCYRVTVERAFTDEFIHALRAPMDYGHGQVRASQVTPVSANSFEIILTQGKKRQIRRMCRHLGYKVTDLCRTRIMELTLDRLAEGEFRELSRAQIAALKDAVQL